MLYGPCKRRGSMSDLLSSTDIVCTLVHVRKVPDAEMGINASRPNLSMAGTLYLCIGCSGPMLFRVGRQALVKNDSRGL